MHLLQQITRKLRTSWTPRSLLLFILPLPLIPALMMSLIKGDFNKTILYLTAVTLFVGGAVLIRRGIIREAELDYHRRMTAYKLPIKTLGAIAVSLATALCGYFSVQYSLSFSLLLGLVTFLGVYLSYGLDQKKKISNLKSTNGYTTDEIINTLSEAEKKISAIEEASQVVNNPELRLRLQRIATLAREVVLKLEEAPQDLYRARKFLYVYLDGAQKVSAGYARTHHQAVSSTLETHFRDVLITIEDVFSEQKKRLFENDVMDLDIQIEVLSTRLKQEGL